MRLKLLCLLGLHDWELWEYESSNTCTQVRTCRRSSHQETRTQHNWGQWESKSSDACIKVRVCQRDHEHQEELEDHDIENFETPVETESEGYTIDYVWYTGTQCRKCGREFSSKRHTDSTNTRGWHK